MPRTNWAGNLAYSASRFLSPRTVAEAQQAVRDAPSLRVVGSRHCFNDIADTPGTQLSLEYLNQVISLDEPARRVTVEGGIRYSELGPWLHRQCYSLHNFASLPHISVAGACATATHGSGAAVGNLATAVAAIEFIDAAGDFVSLSREKNPDTFPGSAVSLGALGVITKLMLDVVPAFAVRQQVYRDLPVAALDAHFAEVMASGYSVSLFTDWVGDTVEQVWIKSEAEGGVGSQATQSFYGARPATRNMHPVAELDAVNCTEQMGVAGPSHDRLPHFRIGSTPAGGDDLQAEYFIAGEHGPAAVRALYSIGDRLAPILLISEIRAIAADDLWMSPCYRLPSIALHFSFKPDLQGALRVLPGIEEALAPFDPRPHWGKLFTMPPAELQARYTKLEAFRALLKTHDPGGKFRNAFVERNIFGGAV
jgi:xylitol oxidase